MRGVPDQTVQLYQGKDGHVGNDQFFQNTPPQISIRNGPQRNSYQDEKRVLDMKPPSGQISFFVSDPKNHWK